MSNSIRLAGACMLVIAVAACQAGRTGAEDDLEGLYMERFEAVMNNRGILPAYEPLEAVAGDQDYRPLPASPGTISVRAVDAAEAYAAGSQADAFMVWQDGALIRETYFGDTERSTPLVSKSLSKPLTAIAVGRAIQLGDIVSLDQPVSDFITEWQGTDKSAILVRHLLDMRSGLLVQGYSSDPQSPWNLAYLSPHHETYLVDSYPLTDPPGTKFSYSNATSDLVAILIERATGRRYGDFISEEVLQPIGAMGGSIWVNRPGGTAHSGCCMYLPAETWLRLGILLLEEGRVADRQLLPEGYTAQMMTASPQNPHYGLGIWTGLPYAERRGFTGLDGPGPQVLHSQPYLDPELALFDGNSNQVVYISPGTGIVALRLGPTPQGSPEWDNSVIPNLLFEGLEP